MIGLGMRESIRRLRQDWRANARDPKARIVLCAFRLTQGLYADSWPRKFGAAVATITYRFLTEMILGLELRPKTSVGGGLRIYHGFGLVVNDHAVIGEGVTLRNGVTIGHKHPGGGCPVIEDYVEIGANAVVIGDITIGAHSIIGAGSVVIHSFPPHSVIAGNPARLIYSTKERAHSVNSDQPDVATPGGR